MQRYAGVPISRRGPPRGDKPGHFETDDFFNLFITTATYTQRMDYDPTGRTMIYEGFCEPGNYLNTGLPVWRIALYTYNPQNSVTSRQWAFTVKGGLNSVGFDQIWDNRATLNYG